MGSAAYGHCRRSSASTLAPACLCFAASLAVVVASSVRAMDPSVQSPGGGPIDMRDTVSDDFVQQLGLTGKPEAFKCRCVVVGKTFPSLPHEFIHFSMEKSCDWALMRPRGPEMTLSDEERSATSSATQFEWSDITLRYYKTANILEHEKHPSDRKHRVLNHKLHVARLLWQNHLAPRALYLQTKAPELWTQVRTELTDMGCPLMPSEQHGHVPDGMNPTWWADIGMTTNRRFTSEDKMKSPPSGDVYGDLTWSTFYALGEGVLNWDSFRFFKASPQTAPIWCTPIVQKLKDGTHKYVPAVAARAAVATLFSWWCHNQAGDNVCAGSYSPDPRNLPAAHPGLAYNGVGGTFNLGKKADDESSAFSVRSSKLHEWITRVVQKIGRTAMHHITIDGDARRCSWNNDNYDKTTPESQLKLPRDPGNLCLPKTPRSFDEFAVGSEEAQTDNDVGTPPAMAPWFFESPASDRLGTEYARMRPSDYITTEMENGQQLGVATLPLDTTVVAGQPPFGWDRTQCIMCWSMPSLVLTLTHRYLKQCAGAQEAADVFWMGQELARMGHAPGWMELTTPPVQAKNQPYGGKPFDQLTRDEESAFLGFTVPLRKAHKKLVAAKQILDADTMLRSQTDKKQKKTSAGSKSDKLIQEPAAPGGDVR